MLLQTNRIKEIFVKNKNILPKNIFYQQIKRGFFSVIELPPHERTIFLHSKPINATFPYLVFVSTFYEESGFLYCYISDKKIKSINQHMHIPCLSSIYEDSFRFGQVCLDPNSHEFINGNALISNINNNISTFFSRDFSMINNFRKKEEIKSSVKIQKMPSLSILHKDSTSIFELYTEWRSWYDAEWILR